MTAAGMWMRSFQYGLRSGGAIRQAIQGIQKKTMKLIQLDPSATTGPNRPSCGKSCWSVMTLTMLTAPTTAAAMDQE